jgi:hypothetical protein
MPFRRASIDWRPPALAVFVVGSEGFVAMIQTYFIAAAVREGRGDLWATDGGAFG